MTSLQILLIFMLTLRFFCELFLASINLRRIKQNYDSIPKSILEYMSQDEWVKCSDYTVAKTHFGIFENLFSFLISFFILIFLLPLYCDAWNSFFGVGIWQSAIATAAFLLLLQQLELPFDWYKQFRLEERFGFNNQTTKLWFTDKIKEFLIGCLLLTGLIALLHFLHAQLSKFSQDFWWIFVFVTLFLFQITLMVLWPRLIIPLFNTLKPLEDDELRDKLTNLSDKTGFKTKEIQVIDGSKRSAHANAFFTGFGKFRKIVLYDTLLNQMNQKEVISVVAHEIGHYKLGHIPKRLATSFIFGLLFFFILAQTLNSSWLVEQLNLPVSFAGLIGPVLLVFTLFGGSITYWFSPFSNYFSRRHEFEADNFAISSASSPKDLSSALKKLSAKNLSYPLPHPWVSFFYHSHPSLPERDLNICKQN